ncbi:MAG: transposase [Thermoplasmata archaeon]
MGITVNNNNGIKGIILPRKNAITKSKGSPGRARIVREIKKKGEDEWKKRAGYGKRWRVEIFFSGLKRVMGEILMARKLEYLVHELMFKVYGYFIMRRNTIG